MMVEIFAVFDAVADRFIDPFPAPNVGVALRGFEEACLVEGSQFSKHPEDYSLFHVGTWDGETGVLTGQEGRKIAMASTYVHSREAK